MIYLFGRNLNLNWAILLDKTHMSESTASSKSGGPGFLFIPNIGTFLPNPFGRFTGVFDNSSQTPSSSFLEPVLNPLKGGNHGKRIPIPGRMDPKNIPRFSPDGLEESVRPLHRVCGRIYLLPQLRSLVTHGKGFIVEHLPVFSGPFCDKFCPVHAEIFRSPRHISD